MADALSLTDCTATDKVLVHAPAGGAVARALGAGFGRAQRREDGTLAYQVRPRQWLLLAAPGRAPELIGQWQGAAGDDFVSVLDVTSGRALFRLTGDDGPALLAKVCALDLARVPDGTAQRGPVARVTAEIVRDDTPAGERSYLIACDRSYGRYLFDALADAGTEFSVRAGARPA